MYKYKYRTGVDRCVEKRRGNGKERKGKERKGKERKGKERKEGKLSWLPT